MPSSSDIWQAKLELLNEMEGSVKELLARLENMSDEKFSDHRPGLITDLREYKCRLAAESEFCPELDHASLRLPNSLLVSKERKLWIRQLEEALFEIQYWLSTTNK